MRLLILDTVLCYNGSEQQSEHGMTNPVIIPDTANEGATVRKIADEAFAAFNSGRHVLPFSTCYPAFSLNDAYHAAALAHNMRIANGYTALGRKIGFTNRRMWDEYGVHAPIWGYVYDRTMHDLAASLPLAAYTEPKIEPEIIFGFAVAPSPNMDDAALLSCIAWLAHGFEIAQSIFPGWKFAVADTVVADGMHGALLIGPRHVVGSRAGEWLDTLANFQVELYCDGQLMDSGHASNVLGGPLSAVRHLVELLSEDPEQPPLAAGEIVASGTLTRALPVKAGQMWTTKLDGIALEGISLRFC
jgi:2-oxo-3-hexenedioate decarboxylase